MTAPLPVVSVYANMALSETWALGTRVDRFVISYGKYEGNVTSIGVDVNYQPFRHVGFGLAYRSLFFVVKYNGDQLSARFEQAFQGPLLYVNASF